MGCRITSGLAEVDRSISSVWCRETAEEGRKRGEEERGGRREEGRRGYKEDGEMEGRGRGGGAT